MIIVSIYEKEIEQIVSNINKSKKYKPLYDKTVRRIVEDCLKRYGKKEAEKKARNILHQIWGSYYTYKPNFQKLFRTFQETLCEKKDIKDSVLPILSIHSSTRERIGILNEFYTDIFERTGNPSSIVDLACGLNPLTIFWMNLNQKVNYKAFDIDTEEIEFLNNIFKFLNIKNTITVSVGDVFVDKVPYADVIFMLKFLPLVNHQKKDYIIELFNKLDFKYLVISFPVKSLSGKQKGMENFYSEQFEKIIVKENFALSKLYFVTELVYIVKKIE